MSLRKMAVLGMAIASTFLGSAAMSQENLTCSDIQWLPAVTDEYPDIADACVDVVEKNGEMMAKIGVEVVTVGADTVSFRFVHPDGKSSDTYQTALKPDWKPIIYGAQLDQGGLRPGVPLNVFMPPDRWAVIYEDADGPDLADALEPYEEETDSGLAADAAESVEVRASVYGDEPTTEIEASAVMPVTAGPLPLIGLLGGVFLALGAGFRMLRRRLHL